MKKWVVVGCVIAILNDLAMIGTNRANLVLLFLSFHIWLTISNVSMRLINWLRSRPSRTGIDRGT